MKLGRISLFHNYVYEHPKTCCSAVSLYNSLCGWNLKLYFPHYLLHCLLSNTANNFFKWNKRMKWRKLLSIVVPYLNEVVVSLVWINIIFSVTYIYFQYFIYFYVIPFYIRIIISRVFYPILLSYGVTKHAHYLPTTIFLECLVRVL